MREKALDVLDRMCHPHALSSAFASSILALKNGLDRVKLPKSASREFFEDLAEEDSCICGRPIDPDISDTIRARAKQYMGSDNVALLNSMKAAIKDAVGDSPDKAEQDLNAQIENLSAAVAEEQDARNKLDFLKREAERTDPAVGAAREAINELRKQLEDINSRLNEFVSEGSDKNIKAIEKEIEEAESKLEEIKGTLGLRVKRDKLVEVINKAHAKAHQGIVADLRNQANIRIAKLMPNNDISIDHIEHNLILKEQERASEGETLSIAYAFLATLFHGSDYQLPFVVDSPVNSIDLAVRPEIGELVPKLTGQFIAFTLSSERERFIEPLKRASNGTGLSFITLFKKGSESLIREAHKRSVPVETIDGLNVPGEDFFNCFQLEEEEPT